MFDISGIGALWRRVNARSPPSVRNLASASKAQHCVLLTPRPSSQPCLGSLRDLTPDLEMQLEVCYHGIGRPSPCQPTGSQLQREAASVEEKSGLPRRCAMPNTATGSSPPHARGRATAVTFYFSGRRLARAVNESQTSKDVGSHMQVDADIVLREASSHVGAMLNALRRLTAWR